MYYFIGIKGSGMASLAVMMKDLGHEVTGSDLDKHFFTEVSLHEKGIPILSFDPANIKDNYTVIIGNAFLEDFPEVKAARANKTCTCYRYHEFLGELLKNYTGVCLAGSHGKTTTTTMAKTIIGSFKKTGYLIGDGEGYLSKDSEFLCVEADEFRNHFWAYSPEYAVITNIEIDHVDFFKDEEDYFNSYQHFVNNVKKAVFCYGDDKWCQKLSFNCNYYYFGFDDHNDYQIKNLIEDNGHSVYELYFKGEKLGVVDLPFIGRHLLIDSLGVIALNLELGLKLETIVEAFKSYVGPRRRYVVEEYGDTIFVDDYAHHPTEVKVTLEATFKRYPDKKVVAIFKPHRASRVKHFAKEFKDALDLADEIYLLDFTSIDDKQDGVDIDIHYLADMLPRAHILSESKEGARELAKHKGAVMVFMSSKDIYNIAGWTKEYL